MDPEVSVLLHCSPWRGLREEQVQVEISARYNRQWLPEVEQHIEEVWTKRVTHEPWLFNGAKFRLHSATLVPRSPSNPSKSGESNISEGLSLNTEHNESQRGVRGEAPEGRVMEQQCKAQVVHAERTTDNRCQANAHQSGDEKKDFLGTNWSRNVQDLLSQGTDKFGDPQSLLAQPLGVGGILRTRDKQVVFLRRSQKVAEASGLLDIPGGHPEPKAVCKGVSEESIQVEQLPREAVVREFFSSIQAEIRDEVNVPLSCLSKPVLMGIALNHVSAGRPSAEFYISCSLTAKEVTDFYWQGGPEASESTDIIFLSREEVLKLDMSAPLWSELCPSAKGAVLLYRLVLPDDD